MKYDVFISYRRDGGAEKAELVKSVLLERGYGADRIFMDTRSLGTGNYAENLSAAIGESVNVLVVVTRGCFDNLPAEGNWVREIRTAMALGKNIVPVYFDGIFEIDPESVPESIRGFTQENAVVYVHQYAEASYDLMCSRLPKEKKDMPRWAKWTAAAAVATAAAAGGVAVSGPGSLKDGEVYIVDSPTSKCYHMDKDCFTLKNKTHKLKTITLEEALQMGKRPCSKCCKDE